MNPSRDNISPPRFLLAGLIPTRQSFSKTLSDFQELQNLVTTYGGIVVDAFKQNISKAGSATYLGKGKVSEITQSIDRLRVDIVVINHTLKADQRLNLIELFQTANSQIQVWDRIDLILEIFKLHATSIEAKLQIKLAHIAHKGPELHGIGLYLSQQAGGIGTRGKGETTTELIKRHWRQEIRDIQAKLNKITSTRRQQMSQRKRSGLPTISIIGYTNAGKSTLFHRLTKKKTLIKDALFITLDSSVSTLYLPKLQQEVYLTDTIGFIQDLPHELIDAFRSTLLETIHADVLLHLIDSSDPWLDDKIIAVETVLKDLKIDPSRQIYVFNKIDQSKIDLHQLDTQYQAFHPQFISAQTGQGTEDLKLHLSQVLSSH